MANRNGRVVVLVTIVCLFALSGCIGTYNEPPFSPEDALGTFELPEGFRIELVAAEPLITDPVEIAFDAEGRLFVVEMPDYPTDDDTEPFSRIVVLEDRSGDGTYDTRTVFAEDLPFVNGVMPWRDGILVTNAPDITYYKDTTGDGRADLREIVLTGFAETNPQLRVSSLRYGLDNWIYGAYSRAGAGRGFPEHEDSGRSLRFPNNPVADSVDISPGTNFRFRPDEFEVEPSGGMSQFGLSFDASGNQFTVWNNDHIRHVVVDNRYTTRNPYLSINSGMASIAEHGGSARVFPITVDGLNLHESEIGHFTSASGNSVYTGDIFPSDYHGAVFVCESVSNMVHVDLLTPDGASFTARRAQEDAEFLASTDSWFRPVNTTVGPDGALYVVDMYRKLIEHPAWIARSDEEGYHTHAGVLQESDFHEGQDRGRIYRVVPEDYDESEPVRPNLSAADTETLVGHLAHANMWWRTTAQRLLVNREDVSAASALERLVSESPSAEGTVHALWTLDGLGALDDEQVLEALSDESPIVRKQAVVLAEKRLSNRGVQERLLEMAADADTHVQFQVALAISELPDNRKFQALKQIARQHIHDSWFQTAILLSASENALTWYRTARGFEVASEGEMQGRQEFLGNITSIIGARGQAEEISELMALINRDDETTVQVASLSGVEEGMQQGSGQIRLPERGQNELLALITQGAPEVQSEALDVAGHIDIMNSQAVQAAVNQAAELVLSEDVETDVRTRAIKVLGLDPTGLRMSIFDQLMRPQQPTNVQLVASKVLAQSNEVAAIQMLIERWDSYTSVVRKAVEDEVLGRRTHIVQLLDAVEAGDVEPSWLSRSARTQLAQHSDEDIKERALAAFGDVLEDRRDEVVTEYYEATTIGGDIARGEVVFEQTCSICHQVGDVGYPVGPDLRSVTDRTRIELLTLIVNPNVGVTPGYEGYTVQTTDGRSITGVMVHDGSTNVVLRAPGGAEYTIPRENIESARSMDYSLMPEGLESGLSIQDMADLLEFLKNLD